MTSDVLSISVLCNMPNTVPRPAPATAKPTKTTSTIKILEIFFPVPFFFRFLPRLAFGCGWVLLRLPLLLPWSDSGRLCGRLLR